MKKAKGFTLIELSIVIVIIALIITGVMQGQELIKQANYRKVMRDIETYRSAARTFNSKYDCIPGDCKTARNYFGATCGVTGSPINAGNPTRCNGNGDEILTTPEGQEFWQHLYYAGLINLEFTGGYKAIITIGTDVPATSFNSGISAYYSFGNADTSTSCGFNYCMDTNTYGGLTAKNIFIAGYADANTSATAFVRKGTFTPMEAKEFDTKYDDGKYYSGNISGHRSKNDDGSFANCGTFTNYTYSSATDPNCILVFNMGF